MAKKKVAKPQPKRVRSEATNIRSTPEWKAWLQELADFHRAPSIIDLIDEAVVKLAREIKFPKAPPKR